MWYHHCCPPLKHEGMCVLVHNTYTVTFFLPGKRKRVFKTFIPDPSPSSLACSYNTLLSTYHAPSSVRC